MRGYNANKKKKKKILRSGNITNREVRNAMVRQVNYLNMACMVRTLWTVYGWRGKRIGDFLLAYLTLIEEHADGRLDIPGVIRDCQDLTGVDVKELVDSVYV